MPNCVENLMVQVDFVCEILVDKSPDVAGSLREFYYMCQVIILVWHNTPLYIRLDHLLTVYLLPNVPLVKGLYS